MNFFRSYLLLPIVFLLLFNGIAAQSRRSLEEQRKKTLQEIAEINGFLKEVQQTRKTSLEKLTLLGNQITQYKLLISNMNKEIQHVDHQISETTLRIRKMSDEADKLKAEYAQMVFHAYKNRGKYNKLVYILSSKDFNEAYRRMKYFQQYGQFRKKQVDEIIETQKQLNEEIRQLAVQKAEKEKLRAEQQRESKQLETVQGEQDKEIKQLKSQEQKLRKQVADKQKEAQKLQQSINRLIAEEVKKSKGDSKNLYDKLTPEERSVSNNFKDNKGLLPWPTERGIITGFFGVNPHPLYRDIKLDNNGIDITTVGNANVRAIFGGMVTRVVRIQGENIAIFVRHGNYISVYMNLVDIVVRQGDQVKTKDLIGKVYTEKGAKTAVLHFELWEETNKLNPEQWIVRQ